MKNNRFSPQETARRKRAEEKTEQEMSRNRLIQLFCLLFFLKFLLFDLLWCLDTTFSSFSYPIAYLSKSILALLLTLPLVLRAPRWVEAVVALATDLFLVANLLYFRTYYTAIPLESYALAGNLRDFTASVTESLRWPDLLFPLSTAAALLAARRMPQPRLPRRGLVRYANALLLSSLLTAALLVGKGGFRRSYEAMLVHRQLSATTTYSLFGTLLYEALRERVEFTPELAGGGSNAGSPPGARQPMLKRPQRGCRQAEAARQAKRRPAEDTARPTRCRPAAMAKRPMRCAPVRSLTHRTPRSPAQASNPIPPRSPAQTPA